MDEEARQYRIRVLRQEYDTLVAMTARIQSELDDIRQELERLGAEP